MRISLVKKILVLLAFMLIVTLINAAIVFYYQSLQSQDSFIINLAGRQRMLSQRIALYTHVVSEGGDDGKSKLKKSIDAYDHSLKLLYKGGLLSGTIIPKAPDEMARLFKENIALWEKIKKRAELILTGQSTPHDLAKAAEYVDKKAEELLEVSSMITERFEETANKKKKNLNSILKFTMGVNILVFLIGGYNVYRVLNPIKKLTLSALEISKGDLYQKVKVPEYNDELRDLSISFNIMTANLVSHLFSREYLNGIINTMADMLFVIDTEGAIRTVNNAAYTILGYEPESLSGKLFSQLFEDEDYLIVETMLRNLSGNKALEKAEITIRNKDGNRISLLCGFTLMKDREGDMEDIICAATDITERKQKEEDLRKLSKAVEQSLSSIVITDREGKIEFANQKFTETTGYTLKEVKGLTPRILKSGYHSNEFYEKLWQTITSGKEFKADIRNRKKDGTLYWELLSISPIKDTYGNITHFLSVKIDDTERKRAEERLQYLAHYDTLTGIPNRTLFKDRINQAIKAAVRYKNKTGILVLDLDRFKNVNDTYGHSTGDKLLKEVAQKLEGSIRKTDTVSRSGGDEFQILLYEIKNRTDAETASGKIIKAINEVYSIDGHTCHIGVSIGISIYPDDGENMEELLKNADLAMYHAKECGKNCAKFYDREIDMANIEQVNIEKALRQALEREELILHYQPQVDLQTGKITGTESLIRWRHPEMGLVSPGRFIHIAEETGLIIPIGKWVIKQACNQNMKWQAMGFPPIRVSVNLASRHFIQRDLVSTITSVLEESGMHAEYLDIEITESGIMEDVEESLKVMKKLKELGIRISIDDFGTGYSSLVYLKKFPIDILKLDQSFIKDSATEPSDAVITSTIISMAHSLDMKVIGEGVEKIDQLELLRSLKCDEVQGYIFSKPMPETEIVQLFKEEHIFRVGQ